MLFALFVFCSFLFGNVRSVFVLKIVLKACKSAEPVALDRFVSPPERFIDVLLFNKGHRPVIQARPGVSRLGFRWGIHSHHRKTKMTAA